MANHRLILMRHGEAESAAARDHARVLTPRGRAQAKLVGEAIARAGWTPAKALVSDAARAQETFALASTGWDPKPVVESVPAFYLAPYKQIIAGLEASGLASGDTILALGHNPGWSDAVSRMVGGSYGMRPADAALLQVDAESWDVALQMAPAWELVEIISG